MDFYACKDVVNLRKGNYTKYSIAPFQNVNYNKTSSKLKELYNVNNFTQMPNSNIFSYWFNVFNYFNV